MPLYRGQALTFELGGTQSIAVSTQRTLWSVNVPWFIELVLWLFLVVGFGFILVS